MYITTWLRSACQIGNSNLFLNESKRIGVIEQENNVAHHTSGRNTGKVHAPYLYNPEKKSSNPREKIPRIRSFRKKIQFWDFLNGPM